MLLHPVDLTSALRPAILQDETLLFVQDAVGLYAGNLKVPSYQNGQIYLTSHRACYIDNDQPRSKAVAILLKDVERCDLYVCRCTKIIPFFSAMINDLDRLAS